MATSDDPLIINNNNAKDRVFRRMLADPSLVRPTPGLYEEPKVKFTTVTQIDWTGTSQGQRRGAEMVTPGTTSKQAQQDDNQFGAAGNFSPPSPPVACAQCGGPHRATECPHNVDAAWEVLAQLVSNRQ